MATDTISPDTRNLTALAALTGAAMLAALIFADALTVRVFLAAAVALYAAFLYRLRRPAPTAAATAAPEKAAPAAPTPATLAEAVSTGAGEQGVREKMYEEKMAAISRFASIASHELKNPLASLKNISYYLSKTVTTDDERIKKMLNMLSSEIDRTNEMITDLLDMSRVKKVSRIRANVADLVGRYVDELKLNGVTVVKELEPLEANIDPDRLRQVVVNLLTNARDAMPQGGTVTVGLKNTEEFAELTVSDTGAGMDRETLKRALDPMFSTKTKTLGMGLTVVNEIARMHEGGITVASTPGQGTTVTVRLKRQ